MRVAGALVLAGVAGFLLGACGGGGGTGSALTTRTGATVTRTQPTIARPTAPATTEAAPATTETAPTATVATTTVQVTTTAPPPTATRPSLTVTVVPPTTSTIPATTTEPAPVAAPPTTTAAAEPASSNDTPWGWIALVLALTALGVAGILLWGRSRSRGASWSAHEADLRRRTLIALDDVVAQGSVVAGEIEALAAEARDLERHASGEQATATITPVRSALDELAEALEADRTLRLATPPPSTEQLAYSDALIRRQVTQLQGVLRSP